ncbi:hypothetical protein ACHHYP_08922 [Achlya hypogyna]|uniref:Fibronectin type-III domain-containing protein n=1 Tax=Achlya hypogyna TaxID=1202772 RepID=A0A1V9ZJY9_ACHHY|nr:hypothetical protein ACHHYP_08922 [Achlya hypogyna]
MTATWHHVSARNVAQYALACALVAGVFLRSPCVVSTLYGASCVVGLLAPSPKVPPAITVVACATLIGHCVAVGINISVGNIVIDVAVAATGLALSILQRQTPRAMPRLTHQPSGVEMLASLLDRLPTVRNYVQQVHSKVDLQALFVLANQLVIGGCLFLVAFSSPGYLGCAYYAFALGRVVTWTFPLAMPPPPVAAPQAPPPRILTTLRKYLELRLTCVGLTTPTAPQRLTVAIFVQRGDDYERVGATESFNFDDGGDATFHEPVLVPLDTDEVQQLKAVVVDPDNPERRIGQCIFRTSTLLASREQCEKRFQVMEGGQPCGKLGVWHQRISRVVSKVDETAPAAVAEPAAMDIHAQDYFTESNISVLLAINVACLFCFHVYQYPLLNAIPVLQRAAADAGVFVFPSDENTGYVFLVAQVGLFLSTSKLRSFYRRTTRPDVNYMASNLPDFVARVFRFDLVAVAAAVFWCISYPSYVGAGLFGLAFAFLATYGLPTRHLLTAITSYGLAYVAAEYIFLLPPVAGFVSTYFKELDYSFTDLAVQNGCMLVLCCCQRIRRLRPTPMADDIAPVLPSTHALAPFWLWFQDLQTMALRHVDKMVLFTIFVVVLSTSANLFQTGFLILATYLSIFQEHRERLWRVLLLYALAVCFAVYTWNVTCPVKAPIYDIVGLTCYRDATQLVPPTPTSNATSAASSVGLWASSLFNAQLLLIAQVVAQLVLYHQKAHLRPVAAKRQDRPWYFVSRLVLEVDRLFRVAGAAISYFVLLLLALVWERAGDAHTTLVGLLQLLLFGALVDSHLSNLEAFPRGTPHLRRLWRVVLVTQLVVLVLRYVYQFEPIATAIEGHWRFPYFSMQDIGFRRLASNTHLSGLFLYLLPTCTMAGLAAWQLASMDKPIHVHAVFATPRWLHLWQYVLCAIHLVSHSAVALVLVAAVLATVDISATGFVFWIAAALATPNRRYATAWPYLFSVALLSLMGLYIVQLDLSWLSLPVAAETRAWLGFPLLQEAPAASLWRLGRSPILLLTLCSFQRVARWLVPANHAPPPAVKIWTTLVQGLFTRPVGIGLVMFALVVAAFVHLNIVSIGYLLLVRSIRRADWKCDALYLFLARRVTLTVLSLAAVQYALLLWVPSWLLESPDAYPPWAWLSPAAQQWLFLQHHHKWSLVTDFFVLLAISWLPRPTALTTIETFPSPPEKPPALWMTLRQGVLHYAICVVLVFVFVTGCAQFGVASGIYLGYSIYMLFHLDRSDLQPGLLASLQTYNWGYLLALAVYQMPWLTDATQSCTVGTHAPGTGVCLSVPVALGLYKASASRPTLSILIFLLLLLQAQIFESPAYYDVLQYHRNELERCQKRGFLLNDAIAKERIRKWRYLKQEKATAIQRLKVIVSKLVNKVEEMMDIAMGLHYSLPPVAPMRPTVVATTQSSVTLQWVPPESKIHKIRSYRISRQVYPSLTLLGDYSDVVTVKGSYTTFEVKNLRPGTSYQFKVAAVSRMGEGPYSAPSEPASTFALNWGDACTGGWLRTYKRSPALLRLSTYFPALRRPHYTQRYVLVDADRLSMYRSEGVAMQHRQEIEAQRKGRRKPAPKTKREVPSFRLCHVTAIDLSEHQYQLDEMSPKMYCIEVTTVVPAAKGATTTTQYSFQPEATAQFDVWMAALAFAVPPSALGARILAYQSAKHLSIPSYLLHPEPLPTSPRPLLHASSSDRRGAISSERQEAKSSNQSTALLPTDTPPGPPAQVVLYLHLYNCCYSLQDVALQHETRAVEIDEIETTPVPTAAEFRCVVVNMLRSHSGLACYVAFVASFAFQADMLNLVYVVALFVVVLCENPRPSAYLWKWILKYSFGALLVRYLFQLPFFCQNYTTALTLYPSMQPFCPAEPLDISTAPFQPLVLFGLYKYDGSANKSVANTFQGLQWNFVVICCVLCHRRELQVRGFWLAHVPAVGTDAKEDDALGALPWWQYVWRKHFAPRDKKKQAVVYSTDLTNLHLDALKAIEETEQQEMDEVGDDDASRTGDKRLQRFESTDSLNGRAFELADYLAKANAPAQLPAEVVHHHTRSDAILALNSHVERLLDEGGAEPQPAALRLHPLSPSFDLDDDESDASDDDSKASSTEPAAAPPAEYTSAPPPTTTPFEEMNPVYIAEAQHEIAPPSRFRALFGREPPAWLVDYYAHLLPAPPADWDKDIKKAAVGTKPGRDLTLVMFGICALSMAYAVLFFHALGEPAVPGESSSALNFTSFSASMLSGYMVAIVFFHVAVIIWDRVAYVYGSLTIKLLCHYWVVLMVHLMLWVVIPRATKAYLTSQPALVVYYLLQCAYLAVSAQQLKYGYVVFRGNPLSVRKSDSFTKSCFGIYMATPFAFEMRALLDYICSTTALDMSMWLTLEGIAAHLYQVKLNMTNRILDGDTIKGNQRQAMGKKLKGAGVYFAGILVCLVAPLALFSTANPTTAKNAVLQASVQLGLIQTDGTFQLLYTSESNTNPAYPATFASAAETYAQQVSFASYSSNLWSSSPPLRRGLIEKLKSTDEIQWKLTFTFVRAAPAGQQAVTYTVLQNVTASQRQLMAVMMDTSTAVRKTATGSASDNLTLPAFYPSVLNVAAATPPVARAPFLARSIQLGRLQEDSVGSYWSMVSIDATAYNDSASKSPLTNTTTITCPSSQGFCLVTVSDNIVAGLNTLGIGSYGITATYIFVLFTIGARVKSALRGNVSDILYNELPNPDDIMDLVEGIYIARKEEYVGHLKDESRLFETLIRVLRSPETLLKVTGPNVIHIPPTKEKID